MDRDQFDGLTKLLAASPSRRTALGALIGAGLMAGSWIGRGKAAAAQASMAQMTCIQDADCRDGDADPCTGAACVDGLCTFFIVDCIAGYTCCGNGECCPVGMVGGCQADIDCVPTSSDPCWGVTCVHGTCVAQHVLCPAGEFCRLGSCAPIGPAPIPVP